MGVLRALGISSLLFFQGWWAYSATFTPLIFPDTEDFGKKQIIQLIDSARHEINLGMYRLEDKEILDSLINAAARGVQVRIIQNSYDMSESPFDLKPFTVTIAKLPENKKAYDRLKVIPTVSIKTYPVHRAFLYHAKFMTVDDKMSMLSTFNFNSSGFNGARNIGVLIQDSGYNLTLKEIFDTDFNDSNAFPVIRESIAVAPLNYLQELRKFFIGANETLDVYQTGLSKADLCDFLDAITNIKKLRVRVLTSLDVFSKESKKEDLKYCLETMSLNQNIQIREISEKNFYIHAKVLLSDSGNEKNGKIFLGSSNFIDEGLLWSREMGIIFSDQTVMHEVAAVFQHDWEKARPLR